MSISDLGRDARLKSATVTAYLSLMEISCVFYRLAPYLRNPASRLIKSPKLYLGDSGIACYLAEVEKLTPENHLKGAMLETYVAQNLVSMLDATWPRANRYFWNIQGRHEVDFIIEAGNCCIAIEVKAAARWEKEDLASLKTFIATTPHCRAGIFWPITVRPRFNSGINSGQFPFRCSFREWRWGACALVVDLTGLNREAEGPGAGGCQAGGRAAGDVGIQVWHGACVGANGRSRGKRMSTEFLSNEMH